MTDINERLARLEQTMERIESNLNTIGEATTNNNKIAAKLGEFIWVLEKIGEVMGTLQDSPLVNLLSDDPDP